MDIDGAAPAPEYARHATSDPLGLGSFRVIGDIFSGRVACVEAFQDVRVPMLFPEEEALVARAVAARRQEFATARACARAALARLGVGLTPIVRCSGGAPQWPSGVVGSITHCAGYRASAVAHKRDILTLGVDAEPNHPLPIGVLDQIVTPSEGTQMLALRKVRPDVHWDRLLFSAKECVYKAWFPLAGCWLEFTQASITFEAKAGTFAARLLVPGPDVGGHRIAGFEGRWAVGAGLLLTAIAVPATGASQ